MFWSYGSLLLTTSLEIEFATSSLTALLKGQNDWESLAGGTLY